MIPKTMVKTLKKNFHPKNFNFDEISCASFHQSYHPEHTLSPKLISTEQTSLPKWLSETDLVIKFCQHTLLPKFRKSGQVKAGQNRLGQDRTIFSCMGLYVSFCSNMYLYGPACSCMVPYMVLYSQLLVFGGYPLDAICSHSFVEVIVSFLEEIL